MDKIRVITLLPGFIKGSKTALKKRQKIVTVSFLITIGLIVSTQTINLFTIHYRLMLALAFFSYILSLWALWEGMTKLKAMMVLILPAMYTLAVTSFYFLLPVRWLTRLPVAFLFGLSFYLLLLAQNVFNVAAQRTIPLYRAASTVAFLFTLITAFFIFNVIFALRISFYLNGLLIFLISLPLILQMLWSIEMDRLTAQILIYTVILSMLIGELAVALSFWPVVPTTWSLVLSTMMYVMLGITSQFLKDRLTNRQIWEYVGIASLVFIFTFISTSWTG